jgi:hypothetical protein
MGFRLETDLPAISKQSYKAQEQPRKIIETYKRPLEDFIDFTGSFDGSPYKRDGDTKKMNEI